ncbi:aspartic and glutamic acid-rich protein [Drosophila serrata]|uniref:aspartic and glutamic acid-rich protein n=1 Tax=Drosophila serrata TaxID=7274 RepID=UPI000A1D008B|nr:aspartic and glutamic acid-rich protein [Drosophila serrata]
MDLDWWQPSIIVGLICLLLPSQITPANAWSLPARDSAVSAPVGRRLNEVSPYVDLALCPIRAEPWTCARQQSARILDAWDGELQVQWQKLKVEADRQMNATIERRGYSASELPLKEKPSTILKKIEIGTNYMKKYLAESMDGFLGREYEYLQTPKAAEEDSENDDGDDDDETDAAEDTDTSDAAEETADEEEDAAKDGEEEDDDDDDEDENDDASDSTAEQDAQDTEAEAENDDEDVDEAASEPEKEAEKETVPSIFSGQPATPAATQDDGKSPVFSEANTSSGVEFIELQDGDETAAGALKKPGGGGGKRKKNKKKKGGKRKKNKKGQGQDTQPATLVVVQQAPEHHEVDHGHGSDSAIFSHGSSHDDDDDTVAVKPMRKRKQKRRMKGKRKRKGQHGGSNSVVEHEQSDLSLGLGLLDELVDADDYAGGKRKHRNPLNYGRSNGVTRGKKKKKKKAIAKFMLIGSFLKAKIELLLKILGAHLQVKFFAIALIGLLINIARFWIDVKRGSPPSKHHYEDHGDDWSEQGSYWKRSLQTDPSIEDTDSSTDSYQLRQAQPQQQLGTQDPHYLAYRNQYQWQ